MRSLDMGAGYKSVLKLLKFIGLNIHYIYIFVYIFYTSIKIFSIK